VLCNEDSCFCPTATVVGPQCTSCLASVDTYVASVLSSAISVCRTESFVQPQCSKECSPISQDGEGCIDDACYCSIVLAQGRPCSQCWATINSTEAAFYGQAITYCGSEFPSVPTGTAFGSLNLPHCSAYCDPINQAAMTCTEDQCLCRVVIGVGSQCSSCWATANPSEADYVASQLTLCQSELFPYPPPNARP
jgi:hypothetical protein